MKDENNDDSNKNLDDVGYDNDDDDDDDQRRQQAPLSLTSSRKLKNSDEVYVKSRESQKLKSKIRSRDKLESQTSRKSMPKKSKVSKKIIQLLARSLTYRSMSEPKMNADNDNKMPQK